MENYRRRTENRSPLGERPPPPIFGPEWPPTGLGHPGPSRVGETRALGQSPIPEELAESPLAEQLKQPTEDEEKPPSPAP